MAAKINSQMKTLFLTAWYPHRYDAMAGLFVRKHAEAISCYAEVCVLYLHTDENIKKFEIIEQNFKNVREVYVYFPFIHNKFLAKISKAINYVRAFFKGYKIVKKSFGKPNITQVNVLTRNGVLAYYLKLIQKIPYTIIEHWSRYFPQNKTYNGWLRKCVTEFVVKRAEVLMPVSTCLKNAMANYNLSHNQTIIINNVVDDFFFEKVKEKEQRIKKRILHISCFDEKAKNICGLLNAAKLLYDKRSDFELVVVGTGRDFEMCYKHYENLNFPQNVIKFIGEITPKEVSNWLQNSDFSVMFSNYETSCVVVMESLASGVPVIGTPTGIVPDSINETNGLTVDFNDTNDLAEKMNFMLDNFEKYDAEIIRKEAKKFSYQSVGKKMFEIYLRFCNK